MKTLLLLSLTLLPLTFNNLLAEQVITLKDGSQIKGELTGLANGVYTVKTTSMGTVSLTAGNIVNISNGQANAMAPQGQMGYQQPMMQQRAMQQMPQQGMMGQQQPDINAMFQQQQAQLMANPQAIEAMKEMANDPEIMKLISDPTLIQSVTSRDVNGISNNPKTQELLNNPKMRALMEKLQSQQQ